MTNSDPESSPTPSHSPKPRMRILCSIGGLPSNVINCGPSPMLYLVDYPPMYINWAVSDDCYCMWTTLRCISIGPSPTIDIFIFRQPSDNSHFRQPSEPFSLDSSHAFTLIVLGCSSAYGMHVCQLQYSLITCKYVNMHIST